MLARKAVSGMAVITDAHDSSERSFSAGKQSRFQLMTSSLRHRNYRLFFFGQLVSVIGTWMQTVAQSFLVLEMTHSGTQLGLTTAVRFLPMLAVRAARRRCSRTGMDKRRVLYVTQTLAGLLAAVFADPGRTRAIRLWVVYLLAARARLRQRL